MKTAGIIAEYNPFHLGHQNQISHIRQNTGADYIVAVMSGDFVQRGTPALLSKHLRAEAALRCGVDLVLELPVSVSCASAEFFAKGGVEILDGIGVTDLLCFGSEEGELPLFQKTARILAKEPPQYRELLKTLLKSGLSFPAARGQALTDYLCRTDSSTDREAYGDFLAKPNNILGIEYCKALFRQKSRIQPYTHKRDGAGYHDLALSCGQAPSASGIRHSLKHPQADRPDDLCQYLPGPSLEILTTAAAQQSLVFEEDLDLLVNYCLLLENRESLCQYSDISRELAARIIRLRNQYQGFLPFSRLLKTRELTQTRIQRCLLHILLRQKSDPAPAGYARILGFRKEAAPLLSAIKKEGRIPLLAKAADAPAVLDDASLRSFQETVFASNLYESILSRKTGRDFIHETRKSPMIL